MDRLPRRICGLEAVRLAESEPGIAETAHRLGVAQQRLSNWIKTHKVDKTMASGHGSKLTAKQIELRQLAT